MGKRFFTALLALLLLFMSAPTAAFAFDTTKTADTFFVEDQDGLKSAVLLCSQTQSPVTVTLSADITLTDYINLTGGTLTILGAGHKITFKDRQFRLCNNATLYLGSCDYAEPLQITSTCTDSVILLENDAILNMYDGVTIGPSTATSQPGGILSRNTAALNMYGGTIKDCNNSSSVSGAVYLEGYSTFTMYDGLIENCTGLQGGAVGLNGAVEIGPFPDESAIAKFHMKGGTIRNCSDQWYGGGAVCAYGNAAAIILDGGEITGCSADGNSGEYVGGGAVCILTSKKPSVFSMNGGKITNCNADGNGYGGAILVYNGTDGKMELNSGEISGNSGEYGGGIFISGGAVSMEEDFALHNNKAELAGDDIYILGNDTSLTLGTAADGCKLTDCGHEIDGWYKDPSDARWSDTPLPEKIEPGLITKSIQLKAAHGATYTIEVEASPAGGGEVSGGGDYDADQEVTVTAAPNDGFMFKGWKKKDDTGFLAGASSSYTFQVIGNRTLVAVFEEVQDTATVTFDPNGGILAVGTQHTVTVTDGGTVAKPADPKREGYTFMGWRLDGAAENYDFDTPVTGDITLIARWDQNSSGSGGGTAYYNLHYDSNGGTAYKDERYAHSTVVKFDKRPTREGYVFTGWYADKELTERITEIKMTGSETVYAGWEAVDVPDWLNGKEHFAYVIGYADGTVRPLNDISRAEAAEIFFRLLHEDIRKDNLTSANTFNDVNQGMWCNTSISTMAKLGIVKGRSEECFDPDAPITRAEFAAICARFDPSGRNGDGDFTDISGHWAEAEIERAASFGWIMGYTDGTFRPESYISRAEAMTMINRVLNRLPEHADDLLDGMNVWPDNAPGAWYYLAVQEATNSHHFIFKGDVHEHWTKLTAGPDWTRYQN